ncbi:MAG: putative Zn-dependent peptidase, partial [Myxococcota bacterium]
TVDAALWTTHPYARTHTARTLPPHDTPVNTLQQLLDRGYAPSAHHLIVVGPVNPADVIAEATASFARPTDPAAAHRTPPIDLSTLPKTLEETSRTPLYRVGGAVWPLPPAPDPDFWPLRIALDLLEADRAQALSLLPRDSGALQVGVDVSWGRAGGRLLLAALHPSLRDPDRVRAEGIVFAAAVAAPDWMSDDRIEAALRTQERRLLAAAWDTAETARWLGWSASLRGTARSPEQIAAALRALTPEAVRAAWRRWITPASAIPVLLHVG